MCVQTMDRAAAFLRGTVWAWQWPRLLPSGCAWLGQMDAAVALYRASTRTELHLVSLEWTGKLRMLLLFDGSSRQWRTFMSMQFEWPPVMTSFRGSGPGRVWGSASRLTRPVLPGLSGVRLPVRHVGLHQFRAVATIQISSVMERTHIGEVSSPRLIAETTGRKTTRRRYAVGARLRPRSLRRKNFRLPLLLPMAFHQAAAIRLGSLPLCCLYSCGLCELLHSFRLQGHGRTVAGAGSWTSFQNTNVK